MQIAKGLCKSTRLESSPSLKASYIQLINSVEEDSDTVLPVALIQVPWHFGVFPASNNSFFLAAGIHAFSVWLAIKTLFSSKGYNISV